ncbi:MAG: hypothetical protein ACQEXX_31615 [Bacillota bacterium]
MGFLLYRETRLNCYFVSIAALLKRNLIDTIPIFTQCGYSIDEANDGMFQIKPYHEEIETIIFKRTGLTKKLMIITKVEEYIQFIIHHLESRPSIIIEVDIFYLPFSQYQGKLHYPHCLEVIARENDLFEICDHYYQYNGRISYSQLREVLFNSMQSFYEGNLHLHYIEMTIDEKQSNILASPKTIISENYNCMTGQIKGNFTEKALFGEKAIDETSKIIRSLSLIKNIEYKVKIQKQLYKDFIEVSNSRYHFHIYLKSINEHRLASSFSDADQLWLIIANLIMKSMISGDYGSFSSRIQDKMKRIMDIEANNVQLLKNYLQC